MHGRKQRDRQAEAAEAESDRQARIAKFRKLRGLLGTCLECRAAGDTSDSALELAARLLVINPSVNTLWNIRRDGLLARCGGEECDDRGRKELVAKELELNAQALVKGNVKSHEAWSHRFWVVDNLGCKGSFADLEREIALCQKLLESDERNFHCYQYLAAVRRLLGHTCKDDLAFAEGLIDRNFSNYSAWHLKLKSLETEERENPLTCARLSSEFSVVNNALFTEPDDQSGWMFHRFLVARLQPVDNRDENEQRLALLNEQIALVTELDAIEENASKWALLTMLRLARIKNDLHETLGKPTEDLGSSERKICSRLCEIDKMHREYYRHLVNYSI